MYKRQGLEVELAGDRDDTDGQGAVHVGHQGLEDPLGGHAEDLGRLAAVGGGCWVVVVGVHGEGDGGALQGDGGGRALAALLALLGHVRVLGLLGQLGLKDWRVRSTAGSEGSQVRTAVSRRSRSSSVRRRWAVSGKASSCCFSGVSNTEAAATR